MSSYLSFDEIPEEIRHAALKIHEFFEVKGMREWEFSYIADRRLVIKLKEELAEARMEATDERSEEGVDVPRLARHRGSRCGVCYWALYDGDWCQNRDCEMSGKSVGENRIYLTNDEAQILIQANPKADS